MDSEPQPLPALAIAGVFVTLFLSILGSFTPRFIAFCQKKATGETNLESMWIYAFMNGLAGGLILSVGWIHSVTDSFVSFAEAFPEPESIAQEYAWPGFIAMIGSLLAFGIDEAVHAFLFHSHSHSHSNGNAKGSSDVALQPADPESGAVEVKSEGRSEFSKMLVLLAGLSFHSFFVGLALGISEDDVGLFVAIVAHQFFEGIALGGRILKSESGKKLFSGIAYDIFFALSCPIGVAIGIGIAISLQFDETAYAVVNGVFQGLSAGILIYVSLVHVVSGGHHDSPHSNDQHKVSSKWATYAGMLLGCSIMAIIGIWA